MVPRRYLINILGLQSLVFCVMFCTSLFVPLFLFIGSLYYIVVLASRFTASVPFHWVIVLYCCTLFLIYGICSFSLDHCIILLYSLLDLRFCSFSLGHCIILLYSLLDLRLLFLFIGSLYYIVVLSS